MRPTRCCGETAYVRRIYCVKQKNCAASDTLGSMKNHANSARSATHMQSKEQLIECIQRINPSALREFLSSFDWHALRRYLDHLSMTLEPRGVDSHWTRLGDTPAVVWRRSAA